MEFNVKGRTVLLDEQDAFLMDDVWHLASSGHVRRDTAKDGAVFLHRLVANAQKGQFVDHINGDPLDNRRGNLRICSHAENMRNRKRHKNNSSGHKGVYFESGGQRLKRWRAEIKMNGQKHALGMYETREQAAAAYSRAALHLHGEFSRVA